MSKKPRKSNSIVERAFYLLENNLEKIPSEYWNWLSHHNGLYIIEKQLKTDKTKIDVDILLDNEKAFPLIQQYFPEVLETTKFFFSHISNLFIHEKIDNANYDMQSFL